MLMFTLDMLLVTAKTLGVICVVSLIAFTALFIHDEVVASRRQDETTKAEIAERDRIRAEKEQQALAEHHEAWDYFFTDAPHGFTNNGELTQRFSRMTSEDARAYFRQLERRAADESIFNNTKDI